MAAACSSNGSGSDGGEGESLVIGHSFQNLDNQFFADLLAIERDLAAENGIEIIDTQSSDNPAQQLDDVNTLIARGVDVLAIDAIDPNAIVPALTEAESAGIPVIALIAEPAGGSYESHIFLDSTQDGYNACTDLAKELDGSGTMINLTGPQQILAPAQRAEGCKKAIDEYPDITIVAEVNTDYSLRDAEQKMADAIQAHGEVDAVFGGNDDVALGAIRAMTAAGQDPAEKVVIGVDGTEAALTAICKGEMTQSMATFPRAEAEIIIETAQALHAGEEVEKQILFPAEPVNSDNLEDMAKKAGVSVDGCES
ncbi:MAG: sugar ABC transporter substrate-binding protein [Propionibacteriaceae bacterium]